MRALDTNTVIHFFKGVGRVKERLLGIPPVAVALPVVVLFELELGILQSSHPVKRRAQLDLLLSAVTILPLEDLTAKRAAAVSTTLRKLGTPIGPMDTLIAGIALAHGATLVTHNTREFARVPGLLLEDWH